MVLEVVLLEPAVVGWKTAQRLATNELPRLEIDLLLVVQEVVGEVIANVAKDSPTEHRCCGVPVVAENRVGKLVEWGCESNEEGWWHD